MQTEGKDCLRCVVWLQTTYQHSFNNGNMHKKFIVLVHENKKNSFICYNGTFNDRGNRYTIVVTTTVVQLWSMINRPNALCLIESNEDNIESWIKIEL